MYSMVGGKTAQVNYLIKIVLYIELYALSGQETLILIKHTE